MRPQTDLRLVRDNLVILSETTYYSASLEKFTRKLTEVINFVLENQASVPPKIIGEVALIVRHANTYLSGSTVKEAPYEMEYCLKKALSHWVKRDTIITTALTANQDFHFRPADIWGLVTNVLNQFTVPGYEPLLVLIGVPRLYKHAPLYCIPLYHELGHFVDAALGVTYLSLLIDKTHHSGSGSAKVEETYRMEHFADLFAACYAGISSIETLEVIAPDAPASESHPATAVRGRIVRNFLNGISDPIVDLFQNTLKILAAPSLSMMFSPISISADFDDVRPYKLSTDAEMHGVFPAAWQYLSEALRDRRKPWMNADTEDEMVETVINNLTEKSIRNSAIREKWESGTSA